MGLYQDPRAGGSTPAEVGGSLIIYIDAILILTETREKVEEHSEVRLSYTY